MNQTAVRWKCLIQKSDQSEKWESKQLENTKTKRKQTEQSFHHFMNLAGTQIDVSICFTEHSQLSSLAAELWTPCCPLLDVTSWKLSSIWKSNWNEEETLWNRVWHTHTHTLLKPPLAVCFRMFQAYSYMAHIITRASILIAPKAYRDWCFGPESEPMTWCKGEGVSRIQFLERRINDTKNPQEYPRFFEFYHLESRWRKSHVLVYRSPLLSHLLGVAPSTFTTVYA